MIRRAVATSLAVFAIGCGGARDDADPDLIVRVSATAGLPELELGPDLAGTSTAAVDLVFDELGAHAEVIEQSGARLVLRRRADSPHSARRLAASFTYAGVTARRALDAERVEIEFAAPPDELMLTFAGFDTGPFVVDSHTPERVRLRRRSGDSAVDVIEIVATSVSDEWRRLLARDIDVIPRAAAAVQQQLAEISGVRVLSMPHVNTAALYLNTRALDVHTRRRVAAAIDRRALAETVCGPGCALDTRPAAVPERSAPIELVLDVVATESVHVLAARVLRHQLSQAGIDVVIEKRSLEDMVGRVRDGTFQFSLAPLPAGARRFLFFVSPDRAPEISVTGYDNPDYDAAFERGDAAAMSELLERDVPIVPLFPYEYIAAIDTRLCGDVEPHATSLRWISELRLCAPGELP